MCAGVGLKTASSAARLLDRLAERGLIRRARYFERSIEVLAPVTVPRAPDGAPLFAVPLAERARG